MATAMIYLGLFEWNANLFVSIIVDFVNESHKFLITNVTFNQIFIYNWLITNLARNPKFLQNIDIKSSKRVKIREINFYQNCFSMLSLIQRAALTESTFFFRNCSTERKCRIELGYIDDNRRQGFYHRPTLIYCYSKIFLTAKNDLSNEFAWKGGV